ncbi:MAG: ABC transporter ATP-binding protein [Gemmatimonadaceae bacterium]|nr:ABC transporter ATP-binding protein [Gemmatimonadaceae bacterium]
MIEFNNVSKVYKTILGRPVKAVEDFSLRINAGEVFGIAGPNGAGKSTLVAMMLGFLKPTSGSVTVGGQSPRQYVERNGIGYLSELIAIPPRWRAAKALERFAVLAGVEEPELPGAVDAAVDLVGIGEHREKRIKALSKGNLQRVGIAQALAQDADVFILDEPTHGLDPVWTQRFRDIVAALRRPNRAIVISSHNLDELERLADRVAIIDHGQLRRTVEMRGTARESGGLTYQVTVVKGREKFAEAFPRATSIRDGEFEIVAADLDSLNDELGRLMVDGVVFGRIAPCHSALEQQFREAVGETQ